MSEIENILYKQLMKCIENKEHGNSDEFDIQRKLGALYYYWKINKKEQIMQDRLRNLSKVE